MSESAPQEPEPSVTAEHFRDAHDMVQTQQGSEAATPDRVEKAAEALAKLQAAYRRRDEQQ